MSDRYIATSRGIIDVLVGEARSADVEIGDIFIKRRDSRLGYEGILKIKGMFSHVPGLSGKTTDPTPFKGDIEVLLRSENITDKNDNFFARFQKMS